MIVEYIRYEIAAERTDEFMEAYERGGESLRAAPQCLGYELCRCSEDPTQFILRITWDSAEGHLEGFRKGAQFPPFFAAVKPFFKAIREMRHYEQTALVYARPAP